MSLRVHLLCECDHFGNPHGSGHIRLLRPLSHPALAGEVVMTHGEELPQGDVDIILVERGWRADTTLESAASLVSAIRGRGFKLLYTLDDNLLDLHLGQPWHEFSTDVKRNIARYFLRQSDGVMVSTEALRQRLLGLNPNIRVVENALDERLFLGDNSSSAPPPIPDGNKVTVGYMGTHSHLQDLMMVLEPLRAVLHQYGGNVEFQIVGISADARILRCFDDFPFRVLDTNGNHFYPDFVPWAKKHLRWDLAIAPLEDNAFTQCKSDIKFLDYALLGIPGIYSDAEAYRHIVRHGENGLLCANTPREWREALERMVREPELRRLLAQSAREQVMRTRILKHCAVNWKNAIIAAAQNCKADSGVSNCE